MSQKYGTFTSELLKAIGEATGFFTWPLEGTLSWMRHQTVRNKKVYDTLYSFQKQGLIKKISKNSKKFFELTSKGELELLLRKAILKKPNSWDGLWRILIFDIPEDCRNKRNSLRILLKRNNFIKLQASVFISPYPLNREAISYLKQSRLIGYIRLIKAKEIDDDTDLRKKFKLK